MRLRVMTQRLCVGRSEQKLGDCGDDEHKIPLHPGDIDQQNSVLKMNRNRQARR